MPREKDHHDIRQISADRLYPQREILDFIYELG